MVFGANASSFSDFTMLKGLMSLAFIARISTKVEPSESAEVPNFLSVSFLSVVVDVTEFQQT
jgi:hypothetical protein